MRILKPQKAEDRKEKILSWAVYNYVLTGKPVSSELIAGSSGMNISSATVRGVLKELEENGYLEQLHTSGGRVPTDKGYRAYVDEILDIERQVLVERERVEEEYEQKVEQLDMFLKNTSKIIANLSKWAGIVFSGDIAGDALRRMDFVFLTPKTFLIVFVTYSGIVRHFTVSLSEKINKKILRNLAGDINKKIMNIPLSDVAGRLWKEFVGKNELSPAESEIFKKLYDYFLNLSDTNDEFYLDGLIKMSEHLGDNVEDFKNMMKIMDEKKKFSAMLRERLKDSIQKHKRLAQNSKCRDVEVTIGSESQMKEFGNFSLVSSSYCFKDKVVGLVGVLGHKRMEYPRVISIVDSVSDTVERILSEWEEFED